MHYVASSIVFNGNIHVVIIFSSLRCMKIWTTRYSDFFKGQLFKFNRAPLIFLLLATDNNINVYVSLCIVDIHAHYLELLHIIFLIKPSVIFIILSHFVCWKNRRSWGFSLRCLSWYIVSSFFTFYCVSNQFMCL